MKRDLQWFENRIGKEVWSEKLSYMDIPIEILNLQHARVMFIAHEEMGIEYFDTKEERDKYLKYNEK